MRLFAAAAAAALIVPAPELVFAPEQGSELVKRFTWTATRTTNSSSLVLGGNEMPSSDGITVSNANVVAVRDTFEKVGEGRPLVLGRTYESISSERAGENLPEGVVLANLGERIGPLEGHAVTFQWNAESGDYDVRFVEDDDGDDAWLADAHEDLDLRELLPEREMVAGESWELEPAALEDVLMPGGGIQWSQSDADDEGDPDSVRITVPSVSTRDLFEHFQGDVVATFEGEEDDLWTIQLEVSLEADADLTEVQNEQLRDEGAEHEYEEVSSDTSLSGEGTLVWNAARGTFESFTFEGEMASTLEALWSQPIGANDVEMSYSAENEGRFVVEHTAGE